MRNIKLILVMIIIMTISSCDALQDPTKNGNRMDNNRYNYNYIDIRYRQNPQFFNNNYYNHPYFIRYKIDYHKKHNHYPLNYYGTDRKYRKQPIKDNKSRGESNRTNVRTVKHRKNNN
jgi:hypothetical protein